VRPIPEGTGNLLEARIRTSGRVGGVLRIEHARGDAHTWKPEEVQFVENVSDLLGQALLRADRAHAAETPAIVGQRLDHLADPKLRERKRFSLSKIRKKCAHWRTQCLRASAIECSSHSMPDTALRIEREHHAAIDLVLTDVVMPGMHGDELADRLSRRRPSLKVLFMSGYTTHTAVQKNDAGRGRGFIRKPFDPFMLAGSIRNLLG